RLVESAAKILNPHADPAKLLLAIDQNLVESWVGDSVEPADIASKVICRVAQNKGFIPAKRDADPDTWHLRRPGFLCDLIRFLRNKKDSGIRTTQVPFVLVLEEDSGQTTQDGVAKLAEFQFTLLHQGQGQVFIDPRQAFVRFTGGNKSFSNLFEEVPTAVKRFLPETTDVQAGQDSPTEQAKRHDIRVTIHDLTMRENKHREPVLLNSSQLSGDSATGAAGNGLYCLLTNTVPDNLRIALCSMDRCGVLGEVKSVGEKTRAIVQSGRRFDTIAFATKANRDEAEAVINTLRNQGLTTDIALVNLDEQDGCDNT
ncbi:MAG: hypothetical protein ACXAB4_00430, partial [Candidatus Hodarchaeales archaeon]